ncbi:MAG: ATP-binding protein [Candidatus Muiribacteriota bacterium]
MNYFVQSVCKYISDQADYKDSNSKKMIITLPGYSNDIMVSIGKELEALLSEKDIDLVYKIAKPLWQLWDKSNSGSEKLLDEAKNKDWLDFDGNLTKYRNSDFENISERTKLIVLGGVDYINDSSSLADFHSCSASVLWNSQNYLNKSFVYWIESFLKNNNIGYELDVVPKFDHVLMNLLERVPTDIIQISYFLESIDLAGIQAGEDAFKVLLTSLDYFNLPNLSSFDFIKKKNIGPYIESASSFASYGMFIDKTTRDKYYNKVFDYQSNMTDENLLYEDGKIGFYKSDNDFLEDLKEYIDTGDENKLKSLLKCDYTEILDNIFKFKIKKESSSSNDEPKFKKLGTDPVESVLTAIWITLGDFKKNASSKNFIAHEICSEIKIISNKFEHNFESESKKTSAKHDIARDFIKKFLGGLDVWFNEYIEIKDSGNTNDNILVESLLENEDIDLTYKANKEPNLNFSIIIDSNIPGCPIERKFSIRIPDISPYKVALELFDKVMGDFRNYEKPVIPVFSFPYYEELMLSKDENEANRVLLQGVRRNDYFTLNLLDIFYKDLKNEDMKFAKLFKNLALKYNDFVKLVNEKGLFKALFGYDTLRQAIEELYNYYFDHENKTLEDYAAILHKFFLVLKQFNHNEFNSWVWQKYEPSAVVTVLHPSLLEMLQSRMLYLFNCFNYEAHKEFNSVKKTSFPISLWNYYLNLAVIKMPLSGILKDSSGVFESSVRGEGLLHRIGLDNSAEASLSTRLMLKYDNFDDDLSDQIMFKETSESLLIYRVLKDYWELHTHAQDSISIAVFQNHDIQPLIAAVDKYISDDEINQNINERLYHINITIFSESSDNTGVSNWIEEWKERWEASEVENKLSHYRKCKLSLSHRIVKPENNYEQFLSILHDNFDADIIFLSRFITSDNGSDFEKVEPFDTTSRNLKFPILEKIFCAPEERRSSDSRYRVISNRQFKIANKHLEVMTRIKGIERGSYVALGCGDFSPWKKVIDILHKKTEWVVCIDSSIDEQLIQSSSDSSVRDIIGFGSGVGAHGEDNYTISTEQFHFSDIKQMLKDSVSNVVNGWSQEDYSKAAEFTINQAKSFSGLSLIKSTGSSNQIRDLLAYSFVGKIFSSSNEYLCNKLVSLDAYRHWFERSESKMRPDLMLITADIDDKDIFNINIKLIECKISENIDRHIEKANHQIQNGLDVLIPAFLPKMENQNYNFNENSVSPENRPDARYWWLQLHRLIASKTSVKLNRKNEVLNAFERLAEGEYSISWGAAIFTCSIDNMSETIENKETRMFDIMGKDIAIPHISAGNRALRKICYGESVSFNNYDKINTIFFDYESSFEQQTAEPDFDDEGIRSEINEEQILTNFNNEKELGESVVREIDQEVDEVTAVSPNESSKPSEAFDYRDYNENENDLGSEKLNNIPDRVFLGTSVNGSRTVYWEFGHEELSNRHMLIFGSSGMGKTYAIQCILNELGWLNQNSLVVDYTNGFLPEQLEDETKKYLYPKQHYIIKEPLPISPFKLQNQIIGGEIFPENIGTASKRITSIFNSVHDLGPQQYSVLLDAVNDGIQTYGDTFNLEILLDILEGYLDDKSKQKAAVQSLMSKLKPFIMDSPFSSENTGISWDYLFTDKNHLCNIFQLAGLDMQAWKLVSEFLMWDFYSFVRGAGNKNLPKVLVLDEVQNLNHREEFPLAKYLTEGRKFGISLILATQTLINLYPEERNRLFQAGHKLFFKPADTEVKEYSKVLETVTSEPAKLWADRLSKLKKGECYSVGPSLNNNNELETKAFKIAVTSMQDRDFNG